MGDDRWMQKTPEGQDGGPAGPVRVPQGRAPQTGSAVARIAEAARPLVKMGVAFARTLPGRTRDILERIDMSRRVEQSRKWVEARNFPEKAERLKAGLAEGGKRAAALSRDGADAAQARARPLMAAVKSGTSKGAQAVAAFASARSARLSETLARRRAKRAELQARAAEQKALTQAAREEAPPEPVPVPSELMRLLKDEGVAVEGMDVREALPKPVHPHIAAQGALPLFAGEIDPPPPPPSAKEPFMPESPALAPEPAAPATKRDAPIGGGPSRGAALKTLLSAVLASTGSTPFYRNRTVQMTIGATAFLAAAGAVAFMMTQGAATSSAPGAAQTMGDMDRAKVEGIVRDYILANPEIIPEAMERLQSKRMASMVDQYRPQLETPFAGGWEGAADGDVVLVEFFDYACGYCRASLADIDRLLAEDKRLKVVYRELPILSEESSEAAKASLYAAKQGQYGSFHRALYAAGRPSKDSIETAAKKAGFDPAALKQAMQAPDISAEIENNMRLAQALQATGTPTWVVGDQVLSGAVGYDALKEAIARARSAR
jgi:protein-disulfide isomerase